MTTSVARSSTSRESLTCERLAAYLRGDSPGCALDMWTWASVRARYAMARRVTGCDFVDEPLDACVWALASESSRTARVKCSACKGSRKVWVWAENCVVIRQWHPNVIDAVLDSAVRMCRRGLRVHVEADEANHVIIAGEMRVDCTTCAKPKPQAASPLVGNARPEPDFFDRLREGAARGEPTGVEVVPLAVLVLRVAANDGGLLEARSELAVAADKAQAEGDPLGEVLALWLAQTYVSVRTNSAVTF